MNWQTVSIFISSTFKDMHSERDILVKKVFPELREKLLPYRIKLVDIDLRWGITEEQSENDKTIEFCLDSIEGCRPFFLAMLGERYGWIPEHDHQELNHRFPDLKLKEASSITAMEIIHGVLSQEKGRDEKKSKSLFKKLISPSTTSQKSNALFFFRDPHFEKEMPAELLDIVKVESPEHHEKLIALKDKIRNFPSLRKPIENYPCHFKGLILDWDLIQEDAPEELRASIDQVVHHHVILIDDYKNLSEEAKQWLQGKSRIFLDQLEAFAEMVKEELWSMLENEFPELKNAAIPADNLYLLEDDEHIRYMDEITHLFVGREAILEETKQQLSSAHVPVIITGGSGNGKSALMAKAVRNWQKEHPNGHSIVHFSGASLLPPHAEALFTRLIRLLCEINGEKTPLGMEASLIPSTLQQLISQMDTDQELLIAIDGLDAVFMDQGLDLRWIPESLSNSISILLSFADDQSYSKLNFKQLHQIHAAFLQIPVLRKEERMTLIRQLPALSAKTMDQKHIELLADHPASNLPLFLSIALEELRMFASFEQLEKRIHRFPQETGKEGLELMYHQVLQRLETEMGKEAVSQPLSLLYCSTTGLKETEIQVLCPGIPKDQLAQLWRELRPHMQIKNGLLHFYHPSLAETILKQYLSDNKIKKYYHQLLAEFFLASPDPSRKLNELLTHYKMGDHIDQMQALLFNLENFLILRKESPEQLANWWDQCGVKEPLDLLHETLCQELSGYHDILNNQEGINLGFWAPVSDDKEIELYNEDNDPYIKPILQAWEQEALIELIRLANQFNVNSSAALSIRLKVLAVFSLEFGPVHARTLEALASTLPFIFQQIEQNSAKAYANKTLITSTTYLPAQHPVNISLKMHIQKLWMAGDPSSDEKEHFNELMDAFSDETPCEKVREDPRDLPIRKYQLLTLKALVITAFSQSLRLKGEIEEAEKYCVKAYNYSEKELGPLHELTIQALNNLAMVRMESKGDFEYGKKILKDTLERADARIGKYSSLGLALINNLSTSFGKAGQYKEGLSYYREALERKLIVLGALNTSTLHSRYNLAFCLRELEEYTEAIKECYQAFEGFQEIGRTNDAILMLIHQSNMHQEAHQMNESIETFNKAHQLFDELEENQQNWNTYYLLTTRLADLYESNEEFDKAWEVYWKQLEDLKNMEAAQNHLEGLFNKMKTKLSDQLQIHHQKNQMDPVIMIIKELLRLHTALLDENHPEVLNWKSELCEAMIKQEKYEEVEPLIREVVTQFEKVSGKQAPQTRIAVTHLTRVLTHLGKGDEASKIFKESLEAGSQRKMDTETLCKELIEKNEKEFGPEHPHTLKSIDETAEELLKEENMNAAFGYLQLAFERSENAYGPLAIETLERGRKMASLLRKTSRFSEAEPLLRRIVNTYENSQGLKAPDTLVAMDELASILDRMEEYAEAIKILEKGLTGKQSLYGVSGLATLESHGQLVILYEKVQDKEAYTEHLNQLHHHLQELCQIKPMKELVDRYLEKAQETLHERIHLEVKVIKQLQSEGKADYLGNGEEEIRATAKDMAEKNMDAQHPDGIEEIERWMTLLQQMQPYPQAIEIWESFCEHFENQMEEGALIKYTPRYHLAEWQLDWKMFVKSIENLQKVMIEGHLKSHHSQLAQRVYINMMSSQVETEKMSDVSEQMFTDLLNHEDANFPPLQLLKNQIASYFMIKKEYAKAAQLYTEILEQIPSQVEVFRYEIQASLGEAWFYLGEKEKGLQVCQEAWSFFAQNEQYSRYFGHVACHLANILDEDEEAKELWGFVSQNANHLLNEIYEHKEYENSLANRLNLENLAHAAHQVEAYPTLVSILMVTSVLHKRLGHYHLMNECFWTILGHLNDIENVDETYNYVVKTWRETEQKEMLEKLKEITGED